MRERCRNMLHHDSNNSGRMFASRAGASRHEASAFNERANSTLGGIPFDYLGQLAERMRFELTIGLPLYALSRGAWRVSSELFTLLFSGAPLATPTGFQPCPPSIAL